VTASIQLSLRRGAFELAVDLAFSGPLVVVGPNGAGKTTLLRAVAGLVEGATGRIVVGGRPWLDTQRGVALPPEARRAGYVPQGLALFPRRSALDNVAFGLAFERQRPPRAERRRRARTLLSDLGAAELAERPARTLSGGEAALVALARALARAPDLLLLDEPLAALDAARRRRTRRFLSETLARIGVPTLLVTHDANDVRGLAGSCAVLEGGHIVQHGTFDDLVRRPATAYVAELVGAEASSEVPAGTTAHTAARDP